MNAPHFQGGPRRDSVAMVRTMAAFRDEGGLPGEASLMLSQLLLNLVGHAGRAGGLQLIAAFLDAADVQWERQADDGRCEDCDIACRAVCTHKS